MVQVWNEKLEQVMIRQRNKVFLNAADVVNMAMLYLPSFIIF